MDPPQKPPRPDPNAPNLLQLTDFQRQIEKSIIIDPKSMQNSPQKSSERPEKGDLDDSEGEEGNFLVGVGVGVGVGVLLICSVSGEGLDWGRVCGGGG